MYTYLVLLPRSRHKDGTPPFLEILAVRHGLQSSRKLTTSMALVTKHTFYLAQYVYTNLKKLRHFNERNVCECYCDTEYKSSSFQGPIVNFNVLKSDGSYVGYAEVGFHRILWRIKLGKRTK
jgi:molybdenum cofactor sulfurtransferase